MPVPQKSGADAATKPSLRDRLHAWWEGYELPPETSPKKNAKAGAPVKGGGVTAADRDDDEDDDEDDSSDAAGVGSVWPGKRRKLAQVVWGPGFILPGGPRKAWFRRASTASKRRRRFII